MTTLTFVKQLHLPAVILPLHQLLLSGVCTALSAGAGGPQLPAR